MNTLNWQTPTTPLPMEINPRTLFDRMFGGGNTREERLARMRTDRSVLDLVKADLADLSSDLGPTDKARLDEYLGHVREVERRIQRTEQQADTQLAVPGAPVGVPESFEEHVAVLFDLLALAYEADLTRVFTFMMAREVSQRTYPQIGVTEPHHSISHHGNKPDKIAGHAKHQRLPHAAVRQIPAASAVDAGRRRDAARSFADRLRQRHEQRQRAHAVARCRSQ